MITTRKEYAERLQVSERTVKNYQEALGLDTSKAVLTDNDVALLDLLRSLLLSGCKMAEAVEQVKALNSTAIPAGEAENPFFQIIKDDVLGSAVDAAIPHFPQWIVERVLTRKDEIRAGIARYFASSQPLKPMPPPPPPDDDTPPLPSLAAAVVEENDNDVSELAS